MLSINLTYAQQWCAPGAKWHYSLYHFGSTVVDYLTIEYSRDTTLNGIASKILKRSSWVCDGRFGDEYTYDTGGVVYFYNKTDSLFHSFYDWNMVAGDSSFFLLENFTPTMDTLHFKIDSVIQDVISGIAMRRYFVTYRGVTVVGFQNIITPVNSQWLEGIGDLDYMFPYYSGSCDALWAHPIRCYFDSTLTLVDFDTLHDCDYIILGVEENNFLNELNVFPNPVHDVLKLENRRNEEYSFRIISTTGNIIRTGKAGTFIDFSEVEKGIYILELGKGSYSSKRIVIRE